MRKPSKKGQKRYESFTGREPASARVSKKSTPREWICIANPVILCYDSSKINGGGDGTRQGFKHRFGAKVRLFTNPEGTMLLIAGPGLRITPRGIVG